MKFIVKIIFHISQGLVYCIMDYAFAWIHVVNRDTLALTPGYRAWAQPRPQEQTPTTTLLW